ncbi:hypothetical protein FCJ61_03095 [Burkholderia metallica]|nr:hypothetical protein [Burkholderia metallica]
MLPASCGRRSGLRACRLDRSVLTRIKNAYHGEKFRIGSHAVRRARVHVRGVGRTCPPSGDERLADLNPACVEAAIRCRRRSRRARHSPPASGIDRPPHPVAVDRVRPTRARR